MHLPDPGSHFPGSWHGLDGLRHFALVASVHRFFSGVPVQTPAAVHASLTGKIIAHRIVGGKFVKQALQAKDTQIKRLSTEHTCVGIVVVAFCASFQNRVRAATRARVARSTFMALTLRKAHFVGGAQIFTLAHASAIALVFA